MGERGPAPKPNVLRQLHKEKPYRINNQEPKPSRGKRCPAPPAWLQEQPYAIEKWDELAPELWRLGLLTVMDVEAFAMVMLAYQRQVDAAEDVRVNGYIIDTPKGPVRNPSLITLKESADLIRGMANHFGLTPSGRQALKSDAPQADDMAALYG